MPFLKSKVKKLKVKVKSDLKKMFLTEYDVPFPATTFFLNSGMFNSEGYQLCFKIVFTLVIVKHFKRQK